MSTPTTLEAIRNPAPREASLPPVRAGFFDLQGFELLQRVAKAFASSSLVPVQYQDNVANCMIALNLARRLGADELMVMQNLYIGRNCKPQRHDSLEKAQKRGRALVRGEKESEVLVLEPVGRIVRGTEWMPH